MSAARPAARGAYSLYVPEYYDASRAWPLVVALHGGSGNGGAFLWTWLREARTRGFILIAPTAQGSTWSLMEPEIDADNIDRIVAEVAESWNVDDTRKLLTGMSDGGTYSYVIGLRDSCQFTHLAPIAASFHPDDDELRRRRPRARPADPHRPRHGGLDVPTRDGARRASRARAGGRFESSIARSPISRTPTRATRMAGFSTGFCASSYLG